MANSTIGKNSHISYLTVFSLCGTRIVNFSVNQGLDPGPVYGQDVKAKHCVDEYTRTSVCSDRHGTAARCIILLNWSTNTSLPSFL